MTVRQTARKASLRVAPFLYVIVLLLALLYWVVGFPLRKARFSWRHGDSGAAIGTLTEWSRLKLRPADFDHLLAVSYLTSGKIADAQPFLARMAGRKADFFPLLSKQEVAERLVSAGRYQEFLLYDSSVRQLRDSSSANLYRAAAMLGEGRFAEAEALLARADEEDEPEKYKALRSSIEERKRGSFALLLDRDGKSLALYSIANRDVVPVNDDFSSLIDRSGGTFTLESQLSRFGVAGVIDSTLDSFVQNAAVNALGQQRGALVAIDPATNEILAIASSAGGGGAENIALERLYEPGSIIKVLTGLDAIDSGVDLKKTFPMTCNGFLELNGRQFYDWARHDKLANIEEALAVSCNVAFAVLGRGVGAEKAKAFMANAGFDGTADLGLFTVPLGKNIGYIYNDFALASYSVGLDHEKVTALHVAMLASAVANRGSFVTPSLFRSRRSILGDKTLIPVMREPRQIASKEAAEQMILAMRQVVLSPRGSGRRAAIEGLTIAMKTGTAGKPDPGYDALVMAFAPVERPKIAFAVIAEGAGPAELAGARIAHDFLTQIESRLK